MLRVETPTKMSTSWSRCGPMVTDLLGLGYTTWMTELAQVPMSDTSVRTPPRGGTHPGIWSGIRAQWLCCSEPLLRTSL